MSEDWEEFRARKLAEAVEASPPDVIGFGQWEKCGGPCCGGDRRVRPPRATVNGAGN